MPREANLYITAFPISRNLKLFAFNSMIGPLKANRSFTVNIVPEYNKVKPLIDLQLQQLNNSWQ